MFILVNKMFTCQKNWVYYCCITFNELSVYTVLQALYILHVSLLLYIELVFHGLNRVRVSSSWSFQALTYCLACQLAYLYIQCTDASSPTSVYDADAGNQDQHPTPRWSNWWASLLSRGHFYSLHSISFIGSCGVFPNILLSIVEAS